ncbi:MAG: bacillithiol biosynthesis deacetylase BshB1 [Gemmatimonadota bacterium]|nr:bacillithiol biosynthesis deacetylase BshB1 [Gemmatimonadota bacterium]MDE2872202.1 bacillithiol biosynthesis deacetylase BshB1 [Gemmatimonadota bacterium]
MTEPLDVFAVMAHPDDAEIFCGGALVKSADAGERTGVLDLTAGEAASRGTVESRAREAAAAAEVLGLAERRCAGLSDASLVNDHGSRTVVAGAIRAFRPRVIVTHWTRGRHPDHRTAAALARDAAFLAGLRNFPAEGPPHRPEKMVYALAFTEDAVKPTFAIDITAQMDRKIAALEAYGSQFRGRSGIGEVFPGGDRPVIDQIRAAHAAWGSLIRRAYAEPYWTDETAMVETLGGLAVSTF